MLDFLNQRNSLVWFSTNGFQKRSQSTSKSNRSTLMALSSFRNVLIHHPFEDKDLINYYQNLTGYPENIVCMPNDLIERISHCSETAKDLETVHKIQNVLQKNSIQKLLPATINKFSKPLSSRLSLKHDMYAIDQNTFQRISSRQFLFKECSIFLPTIPFEEINIHNLKNATHLYSKWDHYKSGIVLRRKTSIQGGGTIHVTKHTNLKKAFIRLGQDIALIFPFIPKHHTKANLELSVLIEDGNYRLLGITKQEIKDFKLFGSSSITVNHYDSSILSIYLKNLAIHLDSYGLKKCIIGVDCFLMSNKNKNNFIFYDLNIGISQGTFALAPAVKLSSKTNIPYKFTTGLYFVGKNITFSELNKIHSNLFIKKNNLKNGCFPILIDRGKETYLKKTLPRTGILMLFLSDSKKNVYRLRNKFESKLSCFGRVWKSHY